jgi:prefoldin beta subunit
VKKEFDGLSDDSKVFKLVGPVLLKQEKSEALTAVNGRLEFIAKSIKDTEDRIKELQESSEKKRSELMQLQQKMQNAAQGKVAG